MSFSSAYKKKQAIINSALEQTMIPLVDLPSTIKKSMEYSLLSGGKRLRPVLLLASNELLGGTDNSCIHLACGLEMIHTYSLIHDDLPAMDDDEYRRGIKTNHTVFGEAIAILAGDGLLNLAYETMLSGALSCLDKQRNYIEAINVIAKAAGIHGMIGGQVADIESEGLPVEENQLKYIHEHKTGALITAALHAGSLVEGADDHTIHAVTTYGKAIGLAFQITDDILDITGDLVLIGKSPGSDERNGKFTFPARFGLDESHRMAKDLIEQAIVALEPFKGGSEFLNQLALSILDRKQ